MRILLEKLNEWEISIIKHAANGFTIAVDSPDWSDTACYYNHNNLCAWDFPERIPKKVRQKAEAILRKMRKAGQR